MTSHHVICHVTTVTCLFIVKKENQKKRNIKLGKIDKRKRKMLVSKHTITEVVSPQRTINGLTIRRNDTWMVSPQETRQVNIKTII